MNNIFDYVPEACNEYEAEEDEPRITPEEINGILGSKIGGFYSSENFIFLWLLLCFLFYFLWLPLFLIRIVTLFLPLYDI